MAHYDLTLLRKAEIEETLLSMMQEVPYEQISVKSLTDKLTIARKTFYHYYPSKQACLESLIDRIILECNLHLMTLPETTSLEDLYRERLHFWIAHKPFLDAVIRNDLRTLLVERILLCVFREDNTLPLYLSTEELACDEDVLFYYISGQVCLMLKWCAEGFTRPIDEMVRKNLRLVHQPLLPHEMELCKQ